MLPKHNLYWLVSLIWVFSIPVFPQTGNERVDFTISFAGGKNVYRIGEPIQVVLTLVGKKNDYMIQTDTSPLTEKIIITPTDGVYAWRYHYLRLFGIHDDMRTLGRGYPKPVKINIWLNDYVRFDKPGKYSLTIDTNRVYFLIPLEQPWKEAYKPIDSTVSNTIDFEIKEMSEAEEKEESRKLSDREFYYLTGDVSTVEKVNRFLNQPNQGFRGLLIARNKALAIKLLEEAFQDSTREVRQDLLYLLPYLRLLQEDEINPIDVDQVYKTKFSLGEQTPQHWEEIKQSYLKQWYQSLPNRKGKDQINAVYLIFTELPKEDTSSKAFNETKAIVLNNFDELNEIYQGTLLGERFWEKLKTPSLIPSLEKILAQGKRFGFGNDIGVLERLIDLDQKRARSFLIKRICNPEILPWYVFDHLKILDDKYLPETDDCLLAQIRRLGQTSKKNDMSLKPKVLLAARYATKKIYSGLMNVYKTYSDNWDQGTQGALIGYFARHNDKEARLLIEERLKNIKESSIFSFFSELTKVNFTKGMETMFRNNLESSETGDSATAASLLSTHGDKKYRKLIEKRYSRWLKEWEPRKAEFTKTLLDPEINKQWNYQISLIRALKGAKAWKLTAKELEALKQTCFSQACLNSFLDK